MTTDALPLTETSTDTRGPEVEGGLVCEKCLSAFDHSGRGRKPKRCPDCRGASTARRSASTTAEDSAPKRARGIDSLERNLRQQLVMLGVGVAFFDGYDSQVIIKNAEQGAKALANLAQTNPKIRRLLETSVEGAGYLPVAMWVTSTVLPIVAHHGLIRGVADPAPSAPSPAGGATNGFPLDLSGLVGPRV